jgi:hypothetical protein
MRRLGSRLASLWETIQLKLGTAITVLYIAAISLVGVEVLAIMVETSLFLPFAAPIAPLIVIVIGTIALLRRRAIRRRAGTTVRSSHVARGARLRTRAASRAPRNSLSADAASRHP